MGTALMVEGVLSACYHICPTHANYQFGIRKDVFRFACVIVALTPVFSPLIP